MEAVDPDEMRPLPPQFSYENRKLNDRVDAFIDGAWRVGRVTRFVDPNFYVRLDHDARRVEHHCPFYKVRLHLEWRNEQWFYCHDDWPQVQNQNQDGNPDPPQADQSQNKNQGGNPEHEQIQDRTDEMFRSAVGLPDYMIGGSLDELRDPSGSDGEEGKKQQPTD
ncbi:unnamed protein product [Linum tenue]|uniref:Uncharacterized protein n=1 Tax=Linum tenue TaxID=586396 RepID=A0AAV0MEG6_9ROSI|nr:unnamed protein product [Linum tenue]